MQNNLHSHIIIILLLLIISVNLFILDFKIFSPSSLVKISDLTTSISPTPKLNQKSSGSDNAFCPANCISLINEATQSSPRTGGLNQNDFSLNSQNYQNKPSEYYIPLGSGDTSKSDWTDITATETVIDPSNYNNIKEAYFIASLRNPTQNGQIEVRLYNVTDGHMVWGSHVIMNGPVSQTITSNKITLDQGNKLYRVQLLSSIKYQVFLDNAKIRIISE